jgi:tetratricopeptide (TPR) repeat protein
MTNRTLCAVALALLPLRALAHGDFHTLIIEANKVIEQDPTNPEGYLKRGELYRLHQQWDAARVDFDRAESLGATPASLDLGRGRLYLDTEWPLSARAAFDRFLIAQPKHVEAFVLRGRALLKLGQALSAAEDFTRAIAASPEPGPELFIERAQLMAAAGAEHLPAALRGLDEGIEKLGPLVTLQLTAIDLELKQKNYDSALARLDRVAEKSPRKESWLARRGEILLQANRPDEAKQAFQSALKSLETLPPVRRNVPAVLELERRIKREIAALGKAP